MSGAAILRAAFAAELSRRKAPSRFPAEYRARETKFSVFPSNQTSRREA